MKFTVVLAVALGSIPSWAWASDASEDAGALIQSGDVHFKRHEYEAARTDLARAYALEGQASTLLSLALAELRDNQPVNAALHFRAYLALPDAAGDMCTLVRAKYLPRAEAQLAKLQVEVPAGADVMVDGQPGVRDPSLGVYEVVAGDHEVRVRAAGREEAQRVTAPAGAILSMRLLVDEPVPPTAAGELPDAPPQVAVEHGPSPAKIGTVVGLGVAAVGALAVGITYDVLARDKAATVGTDNQTCFSNDPMSIACQRTSFDVNRQHAYEWASIGGYVGAGAFALAGGLAWFLWPRSGVRVSGAIAPQGVALNVGGAW